MPAIIDAIEGNSDAVMTVNTDTISDILYDTHILSTKGLCIEDYNTVTGEYCGESWEGAKIRKLHVFGQ